MATVYVVTDTDDDDYFTTCQGCDRKFDDEDRLPLNLECQHTMCLICVKRKCKRSRLVPCSTCPTRTSMINRTALDLKTNHYVLKLIASEKKQAKLRTDYLQLKIRAVRNKIWCTNCHNLGSDRCFADKHKTIPLFEFLNRSLDDLISGRQKLLLAWDQISSYLKQSQNILRHVAGSLSSILKLVEKRIKKNDGALKKISANQIESGQLPTILDEMDMSDEELTSLAHKLENMKTRMKTWDREVTTNSAHQQLKNFTLMEKLNADIQLEKVGSQTKSLRQISLLKQLPLSFITSKYTPHCNDCVSILSFLLMILAEEDARNANKDTETGSANQATSPGGENMRLRLPGAEEDNDSTVTLDYTTKKRPTVPSTPADSTDTGPGTRDKASDDDCNPSCSERLVADTASIRSRLRPRKTSRVPQKFPIPADSDVESVRSFRSIRSVQSLQSAYSARSVRSVQSVKSSRSVRSVRSNPKSHTSERTDVEMRPHQCPECGKRFVKKYNLKTHYYTHTGERPFPCPHCPQRFMRGCQRNRHARFSCPNRGTK